MICEVNYRIIVSGIGHRLTKLSGFGDAGELWPVHEWACKGKHRPKSESVVRDSYARALQLQVFS
jgi:hypothetical protein